MKRSLLELGLIVVLCAIGWSWYRAPEPLPKVIVKQCPHQALTPQGRLELDRGSSSRGADALPHFRKLIELEPDNMTGYYHLAQTFFDMKRYSAAVAAMEKAVEKCPGFSGGLNSLAYYRAFLPERGEWERGLDEVNRALAMDPELWTGYDTRGYLLVKLGRLEEARADYDVAVEHEPSRDHLLHRAELFEGLGDRARAAADRAAAGLH